MLAIVRKLNNLIEDCKNEKPKRLIARLTTLKDANPELLNYLNTILQNIEIKIGGCQQEKAIDLISSNMLEGWCWQSSETCGLMFKDTDYVERGNLYLNEDKSREYFHSWINFEFNNQEYVLDPALNILCLREKYFKTFDVELKGVVSVKELKEQFKIEIKTKQSKLKALYNYKGHNEPPIVVDGVEDVFAPFFRSDIGYKATIQGDDIEKVTAHYYYQG